MVKFIKWTELMCSFWLLVLRLPWNGHLIRRPNFGRCLWWQGKTAKKHELCTVDDSWGVLPETLYRMTPSFCFLKTPLWPLTFFYFRSIFQDTLCYRVSIKRVIYTLNTWKEKGKFFRRPCHNNFKPHIFLLTSLMS